MILIHPKKLNLLVVVFTDCYDIWNQKRKKLSRMNDKLKKIPTFA